MQLESSLLPQPMNDQPHAVPQTEYDERPPSTMPNPGEQKGEQDGSSSGLSKSDPRMSWVVSMFSCGAYGERHEYITHEKACHGKVPASPKGTDTGCTEGTVKINGQVEIYHFCHTHRHVHVAREVEVQLQSKAERASPCAHRRCRSCIKWNGSIFGKTVGNNHFFEKTDREQEDSLRYIFWNETHTSRIVKLWDQFFMQYNRSCDEVWEKSDELQIIYQARTLLDSALIGFEQIGHLHKGEKADAERHDDFFSHELCAEEEVRLLSKKREIFVIEKKSEISNQANTHQCRFFVCPLR